GIRYYTHGYSLTTHDFVYGEDPTSIFKNYKELVVLASISNDSIILSKYGIAADADMTVVIPIKSYWEIFGEGYESNSGDLISLSEFGDDRPNGRGPEVFQITRRDDQDIETINQLMGHYAWVMDCKRFRYSFEEGAEIEQRMDQVYDSEKDGLLEGFNQ